MRARGRRGCAYRQSACGRGGWNESAIGSIRLAECGWHAPERRPVCAAPESASGADMSGVITAMVAYATRCYTHGLLHSNCTRFIAQHATCTCIARSTCRNARAESTRWRAHAVPDAGCCFTCIHKPVHACTQYGIDLVVAVHIVQPLLAVLQADRELPRAVDAEHGVAAVRGRRIRIAKVRLQFRVDLRHDVG